VPLRVIELQTATAVNSSSGKNHAMDAFTTCKSSPDKYLFFPNHDFFTKQEADVVFTIDIHVLGAHYRLVLVSQRLGIFLKFLIFFDSSLKYVCFPSKRMQQLLISGPNFNI